MRNWKAAVAAVAMGWAYSGTGAAAEPWSDPAGRLSFNTPTEWTTRQEVGTAPTHTYTYVITGDASNECHIMAQPNPGTAAASADAVRRANDDEARFNSALWTQIANGVRNIFPNQSASVLSNSKEGENNWPIQRAEIQSSQRLVRAAMQLRPGIDILAFCMNFEGQERPDLYDAVIRSVGHPNDAVFFADAAAAQAARDAAEQQAAADVQTQEDLQEMAETGRAPQTTQQAPAEESREARRARSDELRRRMRGR